MTAHQSISIFRQISEFRKLIADQEFDVQFGSDFSFFSEIPNIQPFRHPVSTTFNPEYSDLDEKNSIWMIGKDTTGEIVFTQAIRLLDLEGNDLEWYFSKKLDELRVPGFNHDPDRICWRLTEDAARIAGNVAYHGELWLKGGPMGIRGGSMATLITRLMILVAIVRLHPDFFFGLQAPLVSCKGLGAREGYMRQEQRTIVWHERETGKRHEDWLVWMSRKEAEFNLAVPADYMHEMFPDSKRPDQAGQLVRIA